MSNVFNIGSATGIGPGEGDGGSLTLSPGKGSKGYSDGSIIITDADGNEMVAFKCDKTISILGESFSLEQIKQAFSDFKPDSCKCPMNQLVAKGCTCGGK